jgi:hypothetical protein
LAISTAIAGCIFEHRANEAMLIAITSGKNDDNNDGRVVVRIDDDGSAATQPPPLLSFERIFVN